jgi:hypothetical protein
MKGVIMKEIIVHTQKELNALPDSYKKYQEIYIKSDPNVWLQINKTPQNAKIILWGSSHAELRESSHAELWESSHAVLRGSSHAVLRGSSHAELWESSHAELWGNSSGKVQDKTVVIDKLLEQATLICIDKKCKVAKKDRTANIIVSPRVTYNIKSFCDIYSENLESKKEIILYKSVRPDNHKDFHSNTIEYKDEVNCPDFDADDKRQCRGGLHLSPTPELALSYNQGTVLKCLVNIKDIVVYGLDISKVRCRKVTVLGEYKK